MNLTAGFDILGVVGVWHREVLLSKAQMTFTRDKGGRRDPTPCPPAHPSFLASLAPGAARQEAAQARTHGGSAGRGVRKDGDSCDVKGVRKRSNL